MYVRDFTNTGQLKTFLDWVYRQLANNTGTVTLTANENFTVVQNNKCLITSIVVLSPKTVSAGEVNYSVIAGNGSFTITHAASASTDRTYGYVIHGV